MQKAKYSKDPRARGPACLPKTANMRGPHEPLLLEVSETPTNGEARTPYRPRSPGWRAP